jgi:hypothetical protein
MILAQLAIASALIGCLYASEPKERIRPDADKGGKTELAIEAEEVIYSSRYSNNGSSPMWCINGTCIARLGEDIFVSGYKRLPYYQPLNDCCWLLFRRSAQGWRQQHVDETERTREPSPLACLPPNRLLLSANPTLLPSDASGGGPARPALLEFDNTNIRNTPTVLTPVWQGQPDFTEHSYRSIAADAANGEVLLLQNAGYTNAEWALLKSDAQWLSGRLYWPRYAETDLAPFGANHARVNYPVVILRDRAVHFCGVAAYDNWDRVRTIADMGMRHDPNSKDASGMAGRQRGNRMRRLLYTWTDHVSATPFNDWLEIDNTFNDGGWLLAADMHLDASGTLHLLWFRSPMLASVRDECYKDISRIYRICYATMRDGKILSRRTLVQAGEMEGAAIPTDLDQVGRPYVMLSGERILGDAMSTPRFHVTPNGRLFVLYYVSGKKSDGTDISENRILELRNDGTQSDPVAIALRYPLVQFFTATPRAGNAPSWTIDLLGHRRGDWRPHPGSDYRQWDGTMSYARVRIVTP